MALTDNLVAYYSLESDGTDATGRGNDLTNDGASFVAAKVGNGADLELDDTDYLYRADTADLSMGNIDFTLAAWVYLETMPAAAAESDIIGKFETTANHREYRVTIGGSGHANYASKAAFGVSELGSAILGGDYVVEPTVLSAENWYFVVAVHDSVGNTIGLSVNAAAMTTKAYAGGCHDDTSPFAIGALARAAPTYWLDGIIDEVGVWKRALSAGEITQLYNGGAGLAYPFSTGKPLLRIQQEWHRSMFEGGVPVG